MFSPRPGRGYRFHSLQVEIIAYGLATLKCGYLWLMGPAYEQRFCWNQNALLKKIDFGNHGEITISWMVKPVTAIRPHPLRIAARCCSFVSRTRYPSRHCDIVGGLFPSACGIAKAGGRSRHSIK